MVSYSVKYHIQERVDIDAFKMKSCWHPLVLNAGKLISYKRGQKTFNAVNDNRRNTSNDQGRKASDNYYSRIINSIRRGTLPCLILKNFYSKDFCKRITNRLENYSYFTCGDHIVKKIGIAVSMFHGNKSQYFHDARVANNTVKEIFYDYYYNRNGRHPAEDISRILSVFLVNGTSTEKRKKEQKKKNNCKQKIVFAKDSENEYYACGIVMMQGHNDSIPIHRDAIFFDSP